MLAAGNNSIEVVQLLIDHGAAIEVEDGKNGTALFYASANNQTEAAINGVEPSLKQMLLK